MTTLLKTYTTSRDTIVPSFHNYADYALSDEFEAAFRDLVRLGEDQKIALMCSEAVWWRCHRRIITDYLLLNGYAVDHLMAPGKIEAAKPTLGACKTDSGKVIYPAPAATPISDEAVNAEPDLPREH